MLPMSNVVLPAEGTLLITAVLYLCFLFVVANIGHRFGPQLLKGRLRSSIYALALAVYCTSWTFFGSVGLASRSGLDFMAIYVGPALVIGLGYLFISRVIRVAHAQNSTSIADFVGARYGKSEGVAAFVALIAVIGIIPYIALQLKAVSASLEVFIQSAHVNQGQLNLFMPDLAFVVAFGLAIFSIAFGTRNTDATRHQDGLILTIGIESFIKLAAFWVIGIYTVFALHPNISIENVFSNASSLLSSFQIPSEFLKLTSSPASFLTLTLLSGLAILLLPRQFHMMVIENRSLQDVKQAAWLFPLYLLLINLFVIPITLAGLQFFPAGSIDRDMTVLALPLSQGAPAIALVAFIGGLSAATAMVIVESVALAIMVSNHLIMPIVLRRKDKKDVSVAKANLETGRFVLVTRHVTIFAIIMLAYLYYKTAGQANLASIGLLSFAAIAQIAPSFLGGLFWKRGTALGAIAGMGIGFAFWTYTLLLPNLLTGTQWATLISEGPWGIRLLKPQNLFGLHLPPLMHGVFWSLGLNLLFYYGFSRVRRADAMERLQARAFTGFGEAPIAQSFRLWRANVRVGELKSTLSRYLGEERTQASFDNFFNSREMPLPDDKTEADVHLLRYGEHLLASAIGGSSARLAMSLLLKRRDVSTRDALRLLDDASAAFQYNRDLLQHALDHAKQGITVLDKDLRLLCWNRAFVDLYGFPPDLVRIGVGLDEIVRFNAERGFYGPGLLDELVAGRLHSFIHDTEPVRLRLYPTNKVIEVRSNPLPDGGIVTTYGDITEAVAQEQARIQANETLDRRVKARTEELMQLNEELAKAKADADKANASKTRFLAAASHDLLQPLNAARLYATAIVERDREAGSPGMAENIDASLDAVEEVLGALLDISRLDAGASKPEWSLFRINDIFQQLEREFTPMAEEKGLNLLFMPCSLTIRSDRRMLRRLLQNLVANAVKYTPIGRVLVGVRRQKNKIVIQVIDTGVGIPASKQKLVFREFHRLDQGARIARGLGLGLSIVERISNVLDCNLILKSQPGQGSVFSIEVPVVAALPQAIEKIEMSRAPTTPLVGLSVLAIDNEPSITEGMELLLSRWGCEVLGSHSLKDALASMKASKFVPDVVIADYHLDESDGLEAIAALRWKLGDGLPAILLTADRSEGMREKAALHNIHVMNKPIKPAALRALLAQWRSVFVAAE